VTLRTTVGP